MTIERTGTNARMSRIVSNNGVVYLAGQVAADPDADIAEQTRSTLERIDAALADAGTNNAHLLSATILPAAISTTTSPP